MVTECYCTTCDRLVDVSLLTMVRDWPGRRGKGNVAIFRDQKTGLVHTVLTEKASEQYRPKSEPERDVEVIQRATPLVVTAPSVEAPKPEPMPDETPPQQLVEDWSPQPDEWYLATVGNVFKGYVFAALSNGESVYIFRGAVQPWHGEHVCLQIGDEVEVRIQANTRPSSSQWEAIECVPKTPRVLPDRQAGVVTKWNTHGFVRRDCGCSILVLPRIEVFFGAGDLVEVWDIRVGNKGYLAREIELVMEEESGQ